jgi:hypothetical protein
MSLPPQKEYESVNWHGENLEIDQDKKGFITISRPPFETVFNPAEGEEISQFIHEYRSRTAPSPQETPLPHIPTPCSYLYIEGMNVHCQDSYFPSRVNCHHCVNWRCWDITNIRETAIRNATLTKLIEDVCKQCPIRNEEMPLEDYSAETCEGCLTRKVVQESLRTKEQP